MAELSPENALPGQLAPAYVLRHPAVTTVALGPGRPEQLEVVSGLEELLPLSGEVYDSMKKAAPGVFYTENR